MNIALAVLIGAFIFGCIFAIICLTRQFWLGASRQKLLFVALCILHFPLAPLLLTQDNYDNYSRLLCVAVLFIYSVLAWIALISACLIVLK